VRRVAPPLLGALAFAVALWFCVDTAIDERDRIGDALGAARVGWLVAAVALAGGAMVVVAHGWVRCLAALGAPRPAGRVLGWYFVGELGKYLPGSIWPLVGRGELAHRGAVGRSVAYRSVVLSLLAWYGAAVLPVAVLVAHPRVQAAVGRLAGRLSRGRVDVVVLPWGRLVRLLLVYLPSWLLIAATTGAVVVAYGEDPGWQAPAAAVLAWVCGFLVVPVPAGAGVREAVFVATSGLDPGLAVTVAVTARLAFVLVDLVAAAVAAPAVGADRRVVSRR
jgi:uncharacterized membrane protein YbhN (UPF0104 family)